MGMDGATLIREQLRDDLGLGKKGKGVGGYYLRLVFHAGMDWTI